MSDQFEVRWSGILPGSPRQVWDAFTAHTSAWVWDVSYEPRVGGAESGLTEGGGVVTAWDPPRHFKTEAERPDGWRNCLEYVLEPRPGGTHLDYVHSGVWLENYDETLDGCVQHTDFYYHTLGQYLAHFADREAIHREVEVTGTFAETCRDIGAAETAEIGDEIRIDRDGMSPATVTIDYRTPAFLGLRAADALIRVFGREAWGEGVAVSLHVFGSEAEADRIEAEWRGLLGAGVETGAVS
ncbi:MAG TPA: SRPBCC domain-containing protein [Solirubrobacterales bacterium]|nr:SRPBCC domain-containing protein [Solirubrobacterales bacterium]